MTQTAINTQDCGAQRGACRIRVGIVTTHPNGWEPGHLCGHYAANCCGSDRCVERHRRTARRIARMDAEFVSDAR